MNHYDHSRLTNLWLKLDFGNGLSIPSLKMLEEAIFPPKLDIYFAARILACYQIHEAKNLDNVINKSSEKPLWERFTDELDRSHNNPVMYSFFLLQNYRTPLEDSSLRSYGTIISWSNFTRQQLLLLPEDEHLKEFCLSCDVSYSSVIYHRSIVSYCREMMPYPLRYMRNIDNDYFIREVVPEKFRETIENPQKNIVFPSVFNSDEAKDAYLRKIEDTDIKTSIRFPEYAAARNYLQTLDLAFPKELSSFRKNRFDKFREFTKDRRNAQRISEKNPQPSADNENYILCQCQFCYSYRVENPRNRISWHCDRQDCKSNYKAWVKKLNRRSIHLENLYGEDL